MDYSAINYVIYRIGLEEEMFVIGGTFAAGLSEPRLARAMGNGGRTINLYVSSTNFEVLKGYRPSDHFAKVVAEENKITIRDGELTMFFHRGTPSYWVTNSGYQVQNPLPLKQWLINNNLASWAKLLQDIPFEKRLDGLSLTEEEQIFKESCISHDWYSGYSDCAKVALNGDRSYAALVQQRDAIGSNNAKILFDYYSSK